MAKIKHLWFDFSDTIASPDENQHAQLRYSTFARLKYSKDSPALRREYDKLYKKYGSHSNVFVQTFNLDGSFWPSQVDKVARNGYYHLLDDDIPEVLNKLSKMLPISIFSNIDTELILKDLGIDVDIFTNIFSSSGLRYPKPHPDGYKHIVKLSNLPAAQVLYIGDMEQKDIIPANSVGLKTGIIWNSSKVADYNFTNFKDILELFSGKY
jgi:HAD superfamily hydrolase (TIGR01549 family)